MQQTIAGLLTDRYPPERAKFKSPLVFIHGVWTGGWCWQTWATHFCNLGWDCFAINLKGRLGARPAADLRRLTFDNCVEDLSAILKSFAFPPVVLGLNLGAQLALKAAERTSAAALVLVSPAPLPNFETVSARSRRLLRLKYLPLIYLARPFRIQEKDFTTHFLTALAKNRQAEIFRQTVPESAFLVREFFAPTAAVNRNLLPQSLLILAGSVDQVTPAAASRGIAARTGADFKEYAGQGHWLIEADGEAIVRDIHRWLVHKLGDEILLAEML